MKKWLLASALLLLVLTILLVPRVLADSSGPRSPGTCADDAANGGNTTWTNPANAQASDNFTATATLSSPFTIDTDYLKCTNFGFAVPAGATVNGITAEIERNSSTVSTRCQDENVKIVKADGTIGATNKASASAWPASDAYATYGSASDLWGETWDSTKINDTHFGVVLSAQFLDSSCPAAVDHMRITVTYTLAAAATPASQVREISIY
jgi:hypothetical protein